MLHDHVLGGPGERESIDLSHIVRLTADDWGWYMTIRTTIDKCRNISDSYLVDVDKQSVLDKLAWLKQAIEEAPKSARWKLRAQVGERVRWYELPEDMGNVKAAGRDEAAQASKPPGAA